MLLTVYRPLYVLKAAAKFLIWCSIYLVFKNSLKSSCKVFDL